MQLRYISRFKTDVGFDSTRLSVLQSDTGRRSYVWVVVPCGAILLKRAFASVILERDNLPWRRTYSPSSLTAINQRLRHDLAVLTARGPQEALPSFSARSLSPSSSDSTTRLRTGLKLEPQPRTRPDVQPFSPIPALHLCGSVRWLFRLCGRMRFVFSVVVASGLLTF